MPASGFLQSGCRDDWALAQGSSSPLTAFFKLSGGHWKLAWHGPAVNTIPAGEKHGLSRVEIVNLIASERMVPSAADSPAAMARRARHHACANWKLIEPAVEDAVSSGNVQELHNITEGRPADENSGTADPNAPWFLLNSYAAIYTGPVARDVHRFYNAATQTVATGSVDVTGAERSQDQLRQRLPLASSSAGRSCGPGRKVEHERVVE